MRLVSVIHTPHGSAKKLIAIFDSGERIKFGSKNSETFAEGASEQKRAAYIKRHRVTEDWTKINPGSLSRYILWEKPSLSSGIAEFKRRF